MLYILILIRNLYTYMYVFFILDSNVFSILISFLKKHLVEKVINVTISITVIE